MSYTDMDFSYSYISKGDNNIADSFLNPALKCTKSYKRSVGFFSSGVVDTIEEGILCLARNGGTIKLIASPKLSSEDSSAIKLGYEQRKSKALAQFTKDFTEEMEKLDENRLILLCELIKSGVLDIKIAITNECGIYHDKLGILEDFDGNKIVFYGSSNSSYSGYRSNYEKVRLSKSWDSSSKDIIYDEEKEFDNLWKNKNEYVEVFEYTEIAQRKLLELVDEKKSVSKKPVQLRDYQEEAINAWVNNNYHGFYVMATGTGKTWTAIYSAKKLVGENPCLITICAPYKHLVKQWSEDVVKAFPEARIIMVSSENPGWDKQITDEFVRNKYNQEKQIIIISTIASFKMDRFSKVIKKYDGEKLLIVDEAHRFTIRPDNYEYMLGLSATPFSGKSAEKGNELMKYFGGLVYNLPIENALGKFLVDYYYKPIYVYATSDEEEKFNRYNRVISSCFKNGKCINPDLLVKTLRSRLRLISMADEKLKEIDYIINQISEKDHLVVYCGDGRLFDNDSGQEIRHINAIKKVLTEHGYKASQFTATENMKERMQLVDSFNKGDISALAAIRCLDEGINIPSIKSALILSSNDDYREFVQRRGRILRKYNDKKTAVIYDVIVLPSEESTQFAAIELRRFHEYAKLSLNSEELESELEDLLIKYNIERDMIDVYDYEDMEDMEDE